MSSSSTEQWRPVVGMEGLHEVSDQGRVRALDRIAQSRRCRGGIVERFQPGRMIKLTVRQGYMTLWLRDANGVRKIYRVHRLVLEAFVGPCPPGMEGCHNNGDSTDNRVSNLRWGTPKDNAQDRLRHGTDPQARKTHCPRGHALEGANLRPDMLRRGGRECLACARAASLAYNTRRRTGVVLDRVALADKYYEQIISSNDEGAA